jgi:hypothetical protein
MQYTVADFKAFCESKGEETFDYVDNNDCAIQQFMAHIGFESARVGVGSAYHDNGGSDVARVEWDYLIDSMVSGSYHGVDERKRPLRKHTKFSEVAATLAEY